MAYLHIQNVDFEVDSTPTLSMTTRKEKMSFNKKVRKMKRNA